MRRSRKAKEKEGGGKWRGRQSRVKEKESHPHHHQEETSSVDGGARFFGCYLLTSLSPRYKGHSYIGFTVNPKRRIRQHNGVVTSGANTTKKKRPWDMVLCIHGFPTNVAALQFEWAWQHPKDSIAVRETAASFKTLGGLANKIKLALTMLTLPSWHCMDLTVTFFSTLYMKHATGCPPLPPQMNLHFSSMDELPCYFNPHHPSSSSHLDHHPNLLHSPSTSPHLTNPDSPLAQTYNSPQHISNQPIVCRLLDKDLSDMIPNASPDKLLPPLGTYTDEHPRPSPFDTCIYSNKVFPSLKKHMDLAHVHPSNLGDFTTPTKECCPQTSFPRLKEKIEPFRQPDTYVRDQPLTVDSVSTKKRAAQNDSFTCIFINESPEEKCQPTGNCLPKTSAEMEGIEPVEVIDLFTPSPDCRIVAVTKKRRTCSDRSDLIDLTRSPLFLDL